MNEILYGYSELLIVAGLLVGLFIAVELGFLYGRKRRPAISDSIRSQVNGVLASTVGLLALLLGFTFSLAVQRYEARNQAVVTETNAIGTTYLRTWLLPADMQEETRVLLRRYVEVLMQEGQVPLADIAARTPLQNQATRISNQIWSQAIRAAERDPRLLTSGLFIQTLNDQIDATAARYAELSRHVPEIVIWLILVASLFATGLLGFASGISGERASISAAKRSSSSAMPKGVLPDPHPRPAAQRPDPHQPAAGAELGAVDAARMGAAHPADQPARTAEAAAGVRWCNIRREPCHEIPFCPVGAIVGNGLCRQSQCRRTHQASGARRTGKACHDRTRCKHSFASPHQHNRHRALSGYGGRLLGHHCR